MLASGVDKSMRFDFAALLNGERCDASVLATWLREARERTRALTDDLEGARELGPRLAIVNPPLWELAHVAWFQEYWCLRFRNGEAPLPSLVENADALYNSAIAAHATRWDLPLLPWRAMHAYQDGVLGRVLDRLERGPLDDQLCYLVLLSVFHEDMHGEAFLYTRQTHGYPRPAWMARRKPAGGQSSRGDVDCPGGAFRLGAARGEGFAFDNECWAHEVTLAPFRLGPPVSFGEFAAFVDDAGYGRAEFWSEAGRAWRDGAGAAHPMYWQRRDGAWHLREFDQWVALGERVHEPVMFVNAHEAEAYCRWAGRRLPSEAEWEYAAKFVARAQADKADERDSLDNVASYHGWAWTTDTFAPFPGFSPGPYREYSAPWFGDHRVLRGSSYATRSRLRRATYRNFYMPHRRDVLAGFRTCATD